MSQSLINKTFTVLRGPYPKQILLPYFARHRSDDPNLSQGIAKKHEQPPIYTKTGDKGTTSLFSGERRPKYDTVFDALGDVDELSCHLGMVKVNITESWQVENFKEIDEMIEKLQCTLQDLNSTIATPIDTSSKAHKERTEFNEELTTELEEMIDKYTEELDPLKNFILPSGGKTASSIHIARSICRRAERKVTVLYSNGSVPQSAAKYINRLSDYLFTIARYTAMLEGHKEIIYKRPKPWRQEKIVEQETEKEKEQENKQDETRKK